MVTILLQKILDLLKAKLGLINTTPETASGATVVFDTDKELPLDVLKATITASQESGTPSPEDPKAITGYSSVVITQKDGTDTTVKEVTVDLGQTVYGGELDVINGTLTITQKYFTYTEAEYYGTYGDSNAPLYYVEISDYQTEPIKNMQNSKLAGVLISNIASKISVQNATSMLDNEIRTQAGARPQYFYFRADSFTDLTEVNAFLAETPLQVVAELQTPIIINLTPANITTINGTNKLSANCGDLEVEYRVSTKSIISYKDLTSDLTIDYQTIQESSCDVKAYQQGNMVIVEINFMRYLTMPEEKAVIITGLPKPVAATFAPVLDTYDSERGIRFRVNTDGELQQWYSRPAGNHEAVGQIVYITDEV